MKYDNQLRYALEITGTYRGEIPLHVWLKQYFRDHPQMGSRDRKQLSDMVYCYYRLGHAMAGQDRKEKILTGLFLCNRSASPALAYFRPAWNEMTGLPLTEKMALVKDHFRPSEIFPWPGELSSGIDPLAFCHSMLLQPDLFIRIRPGHRERVLEKLRQAAIAYRETGPDCLALGNQTSLEKVLDINREAVIQDYSSQQVGRFFLPPEGRGVPGGISAWDCCAASGGKSIMLQDLYPQLDLTVSDIRESILHNLHKRFAQAGMKNYHSFRADLTDPAASLPKAGFDLVIADLPCSGSGTWSRTPEALCFYDPARTESYALIQRKILSRASQALKKNGRLIYITCSVFRQENEEVAAFAERTLGLRAEKKEILAGYRDRADSLFAASFVRAGRENERRD